MQRRRKKKNKKIRYILILVLVVIIIFILGLLIKHKIYYSLLGYNKEVIEVFREENIYNKIKSKDIYSKTLEESILQEKFNIDKLDEYLNIDYISADDFIDNVNKLLEIGYQSNDINAFYAKIPNSISYVISLDYNENIINYLKLDYFQEDRLERYINYENNIDKFISIYDTSDIEANYNYEDTVTYVNANLDLPYFTDADVVEEADITSLVNKHNKLNADYEPSDLVTLDSEYATAKQRLRKEAADSFVSMCEDARKNGIYFYAASTYRSYEYQKNLYNNYVLIDGIEAADTYSARPGYSEHELGLAIDIANSKLNFLSESDIEYEWLINNSYKYGYILRYPKNYEYITGYIFEDWHFRYLGVEVATKVHESNLTYDEFVARGL